MSFTDQEKGQYAKLSRGAKLSIKYKYDKTIENIFKTSLRRFLVKTNHISQTLKFSMPLNQSTSVQSLSRV